MSLGILVANEVSYRAMSRNAWVRYGVVMCAALAFTAACFALAFGLFVRITIDSLALVLVVTPFTHFVVVLASRARRTHHM
jgi:hypothetical protein